MLVHLLLQVVAESSPALLLLGDQRARGTVTERCQGLTGYAFVLRLWLLLQHVSIAIVRELHLGYRHEIRYDFAWIQKCTLVPVLLT